MNAEITLLRFAPVPRDLRYARTVTAMIASASSTQTIAQTATKSHPSGNGLPSGNGFISVKRLDAPNSFLASATSR
jgi:hypothetical protein